MRKIGIVITGRRAWLPAVRSRYALPEKTKLRHSAVFCPPTARKA